MKSENKEMRIVPPEGYEIDKENSTFECIKFKPIKFKPIKKSKLSDYDGQFIIKGYVIDSMAEIDYKLACPNRQYNKHVFTTGRQAKSALAMAQISQIMKLDERFGGVVTDEEWKLPTHKYVIRRIEDTYDFYIYQATYQFLAFHTREQRDLFLKENKQLIKDYLMID